MAPEKVASDIESERIFQVTIIRKWSFLSHAMRGDYTLEPIYYGFHHRDIWLVDLVESTSAKYTEKYKSHGTGFINLYPGSCGLLMDTGAVQKDSHNTGTWKTIRRTKCFYIYLFYQLYKHPEQIHQKWNIIHPKVHHKFQPWYKGNVPHKKVRIKCKSQPQCQPVSLRRHSRAPLSSPLPILKSWWRTDMTHKKQYRIGNL